MLHAAALTITEKILFLRHARFCPVLASDFQLIFLIPQTFLGVIYSIIYGLS